MTAAAKSVYYFGLYLYVVGLTLIFVPNFLLRTLQMEETNEVWIRVVGVLVLCIAFYYHQSGAKNITGMFLLSTIARTLVCLSFIAFVLLKFVSPIIIGFGVIDMLGAIWTYTALKKQ